MDNEVESQNEAAQNAESAKVTVLESVIFVTMSAMGDFADIFASLIGPISGALGTSVSLVPILGQATAAMISGLGISAYFLAKAFSFFIWAIIMLWSAFRTSGGFAVRRVVILLAGKSLDEMFFGVAPIQTISLMATIYLDNRVHNKKLERIFSAIDDFV